MAENPEGDNSKPRIVIMHNGSYHVFGNIPLVHKTQVVSEHGEPLTWQKVKDYQVRNNEGRDFYGLCRCGQSEHKPFCDGTHREIYFDGRETADPRPRETRAMRFPRSTNILVDRDMSLCMLSGFCGLRFTEIGDLLELSGEPKERSLVIAMVERCPSGSLTYRMEENQPDIEPDLPVQIATTTEVTYFGPIEGPLWVTGNVPIERSDGQPFETRNRVTLCNCGQSCRKPICDGTHRKMQEDELRRKRG